MEIKNISIQFNVEVELSDGTYATAQRDRSGNWWYTDNYMDLTSEQAAELERQFNIFMNKKTLTDER